LAAAKLIREYIQGVHGAPRLRVRHYDYIIPVHFPRHGGNFRFQFEAPAKQTMALSSAIFMTKEL